MRVLTLAALVVFVTALLDPFAADGQSRDPLAALASEVAMRVEGAQNRVLLLDITDPEGTVTGLERYLADKLAGALTATGRVSLTDETVRRAALEEIFGNLADVIDTKTVQTAGRLAGAAWFQHAGLPVLLPRVPLREGGFLGC